MNKLTHMAKSIGLCTILLVFLLMPASRAGAILLYRGSDLVYDDVLDITWTRRAGDGMQRTWEEAVAWAADLVAFGFSDWRLPSEDTSVPYGSPGGDINCGISEAVCQKNEMGYMYVYNLAEVASSNKTGEQPAVGGEVMITGIQDEYWSGTPYTVATHAFSKSFDRPVSGITIKTTSLYAWAVINGDVAGVPEPGTLLLLGAGFLGLGLVGRRRGRKAPSANQD